MTHGDDRQRANDCRQAATLKRLANEAYELDAFKPNLTRAEADRRIAMLVLLRHEFLRRNGLEIGALQQGHRGRLLTRAPISRRRMVAIEFGM